MRLIKIKNKITNNFLKLIFLIKNSKKYLIAFLPPALAIVFLSFLALKSKKNVLYQQKEIKYVSNTVKAKLKKDLKDLRPEQLSQEEIKKLGEKALTAVDQAKSKLKQQLKISKNKITVKTSIKGEAVIPLSPGKWQFQAKPIDKIDIYLPKEKLVVNKDTKGIVAYIPLKKGQAKVIFSDQVLFYPLTQEALLKSNSQATRLVLSRFLADSQSSEKIALLLIFNDENNNLIFDSTEKLVPWAGVSFILKNKFL